MEPSLAACLGPWFWSRFFFPIAWPAMVCLFALYYDLDHGLILDLRWNCFVVVLGQLKGFPLSMVFASFGRYHHLIWRWGLCLLLHLGLAGRLSALFLTLSVGVVGRTRTILAMK
ncbi:unnamed protein product [Cuscuta campestris]|uniref:Uncharacterized protein n=1 Tax=Cuscuta campestris TaxID=132261 RepID=A0A484KUD9_9ASTE|nr:unnamed protein product [Cuscuta campestris]